MIYWEETKQEKEWTYRSMEPHQYWVEDASVLNLLSAVELNHVRKPAPMERRWRFPGINRLQNWMCCLQCWENSTLIRRSEDLKNQTWFQYVEKKMHRICWKLYLSPGEQFLPKWLNSMLLVVLGTHQTADETSYAPFERTGMGWEDIWQRASQMV